jgi:hypothetical protein
MKARHRLSLKFAMAISFALAGPAMALEPPVGSTAAPQGAAVERDPAALAALDRMGSALRGLRQFSLTSDTSTEVVLDTGQKVELDGTVTYKAARPTSLYVEIRSDRKLRELYFDAGKLTLHAPRLKFYASTDVKARTLGELAINAATELGIDLPMADMFFWGTEHAPKDLIQSALHVGPATLDGERTDQYAFTQPGVEWQVWISQETSLPKKLVITSVDDPALPQYRAQLHWDTRTPVSASVFKFTPPEGSSRIRLVVAEVAVAGTDQEK